MFGSLVNSFLGAPSSATSTQSIYGPQAQQLDRLYGYTGNLLSRYGDDPSRLVAGFTPTQQQGQQLGIQTAQGLAPQIQQIGQAFGQALDPYSSFNSPLYQNALQATFNPFIRNFMQDILPNIQSQAVGVGQRGGSREGIAQGLATQGLFDTLGNIGSQFAQNAFNQGIGSRNTALGMAPQTLSSQFLPSQALQDIGATQQAQQQRVLNAPFTFGSQLQSLLGPPTILGQSQQTGASRGLFDFISPNLSIFPTDTSIFG